MLHTLRTVLALAALASPALADVIVVDAAKGPGWNFTDLQEGVDRAEAGDTVLVRSGVYGGMFLADRGVTVVAEKGASVKLEATAWISAVPAGQAAVLRGLLIDPLPSGSGAGKLHVENCAGTIWVEDCEIGASGLPYIGGTAVQVLDSTAVHFLRTPIHGGAGTGFVSVPAMTAFGSGLTFVDCLVRGRMHYFDLDNSAGPPALAVHSTSVYAEGSAFEGAPGSNGFRAFGCVDGGDGGDALVLGAGASFTSKDNQFLPGQGGSPGLGGSCDFGAPGLEVFLSPTAEFLAVPGHARRFESKSPVRELKTFTSNFDAQPFEPAFLLLGTEPLGVFVLPLNGSLLVWGDLLLVAAGTTNHLGQLYLAQPVPPLPPGVAAADFYFQAGFLNAGGAAVIGGASAVTVLKAGL